MKSLLLSAATLSVILALLTSFLSTTHAIPVVAAPEPGVVAGKVVSTSEQLPSLLGNLFGSQDAVNGAQTPGTEANDLEPPHIVIKIEAGIPLPPTP